MSVRSLETEINVVIVTGGEKLTESHQQGRFFAIRIFNCCSGSSQRGGAGSVTCTANNDDPEYLSFFASVVEFRRVFFVA